MGFAKETKLQILKIPLKNECCGLAFFSGLLLSSGEYDIKNKQVSFITDLPELFDFCNKILMQLYAEKAVFNKEPNFFINKKPSYRITLPNNNLFEMLKDFGLVSENGVLKFSEINERLIENNCCKKSFIKGFFIGSATSGINLKETNKGYDIEFVSHSNKLLLQFSELLAEFKIFPKITKRKNHYVLYLKESTSVCDLLAFLEAYDSVLALQSELAFKELRNKVNRQTNCINANISKTVNASLKQLEAIDLISSSVGLEVLPQDLQDVCLLRLANKEESLNELVKLSNSKYTKSSLNNKFNKIIKIAKNINN